MNEIFYRPTPFPGSYTMCIDIPNVIESDVGGQIAVRLGICLNRHDFCALRCQGNSYGADVGADYEDPRGSGEVLADLLYLGSPPVLSRSQMMANENIGVRYRE